MPRKAIVKRDAEMDSPPDLFDKRVVPIVTKMTREDVEFIQANHVEGLDVVIHPCGKSARVNRPPKDSEDFFVYYDQFRLGLSFPLCEEFTEVLKHYGIVLAQLVPNSVASVMTFIIYLRRINQKWSLEEFQKHFFCRILQGGYASFSTTPALVIEGMDNKVESWKDFFCRVSSPVDINIPRRPSSQKVEPLSKEDRAKIETMDVKVLDVRQYAKDKEVLRKMIYPEKYIKMTTEEWEKSDRDLANLSKKGPAYREPVGRTKNQSKLRLVQNAVEAVPEHPEDVIMEEVDIPSASEVGEESGEVPLLLEDMIEEREVPLKRRRLQKGKQPALVISENVTAAQPEGGRRVINPKVTMEDDLIIIDTSKEWFPANVCPEGIARSMGLALYSDNLTRRMEDSSVNSLRDQLARHNAAAWCIGGYLGTQLEKEQHQTMELENKLNNQAKAFQLLLRKHEEKEGQLAEEKTRHQNQLAEEKVTHEQLIQEMEAAMKEALEKKDAEYREKAESSKASNRRLRKRIKELKTASAEDIRGGIALCLDQLSKANAVLPEWDDAEKIEALVMEEMARLKAAAGVEEIEKKDDSEDTESDVASTTEV